MTTVSNKYTEELTLDLKVVDDLEYLDSMRAQRMYKMSDNIERMILDEEIAIKEKELNLEKRQSSNFQTYNRVMYKHGVRVWTYNSSFISHNTGVHKDMSKHYFIYVPAWAVSDALGLPGACGNDNQRQLSKQVSMYFGNTHEYRFIEILNANGDFSSYSRQDELPFEIDSTMRNWMNR